MPDDPKGPQPPQSPDSLGGGLRGRVSGVTRIGGRAFAIGAVLVALMIGLIVYGVTKKNAPPGAGPVAISSAPGANPTDLTAFGQDVPVVPSSSPTAEVLVLPSTVPEVTSAPAAAAPVAAPPKQSPEDAAAAQAAEAARQKDEADRLAAEKTREEALDAARRSHILTGQGVSQAGGANVDAASGVQQLSFAGNGDATGGGMTGGAPASSGGGYSGNGGSSSYGGQGGSYGSGSSSYGSGSSSQRTSPVAALLGRTAADTSQDQTTSARPVDPNAFLDGPTNQYSRVQSASNIDLPEGANPADILQAQRFGAVSPFEITAGSVLPSELITGIDSELQGLISAQVREDVYDTKTGKYLLIPKGSRLVGLYRSAGGYGSSRVLVAWQRLIFPDTSSIDLRNMSGSDVQGGAGFGGDVDNHYGKIFGAALLTSVLAAGASLATPQTATGSFGAISPTTLAASQISQNILNIGTTITNKALAIPPTVHVSKGYPFLVVVDKDIVLPGPYGRGQ